MHLIVHLIGGLANRMRTIDSAVNFTRKRGELSVLWAKNNALNCEFETIFKPVSFIFDRKKGRNYLSIYLSIYLLRKYDNKNKFFLFVFKMLKILHILLFLDEQECLDAKKLQKAYKYLFCLIRTWEAFCPKVTFHNELFILKNGELLEKELAKIDKNMIGVHIRRTDNIWSIENSPLELFEKKMLEEIDKNSATNFYVCSDDEEMKNFFQTGYWKDRVKIPEGNLSRQSEDGIVQAACELFALSKTQKILGSYWSSFGEVAARLGNIEIEVCTTLQS